MKVGDVEILLLAPSEVFVDLESNAQRDLRVSHAKNISKEYSPALFGLGHISLRKDGKYYVLDGQHRRQAAIMSHQANVKVPWQIWRGLSIAQEAQKFEELNANKLNVDSFQRFKVGVTAKNPTNIEIVRVLDSFGLTYGLGATDGMISAVQTLVNIYEQRISLKLPASADRGKKATGKDALPQSHLLSRTLKILTQAWGRDRNAFDNIMLRSVAALLFKHGSKVDASRLAAQLARAETPIRSMGRIKSIADTGHITTMMAGVQFLEQLYNRGLASAKRLS